MVDLGFRVDEREKNIITKVLYNYLGHDDN
jgi:hypothetical protein